MNYSQLLFSLMGIMTISVAKAQQHIVTVTHQEIVTVTYTPGAETAAGGSGSGSGSGGWDGAAAGQEGGYYAGGGADGGDGNSWGSGSGSGAERVADQAVDGHYAEEAEDLDGKVNAHQTRTSTGDDLSSSKTASMSKTRKTSSSDEGNAAMNVKVPVAIVAIAMMAVIGGVAL